MPEARELRSVIEAAEKAASVGDYVTAELNLREAAALQEAQLGPFHPDLANTLNNLGVIYERADSPAEAELCYRRAYAIATTALEPNHPFVATSRKNLEDFCQTRGRPFDRSTVPAERAALRKPVPSSSRPIVVGAVCALAIALLVVGAYLVRSSNPGASASTGRTETLPVQEQARLPQRGNSSIAQADKSAAAATSTSATRASRPRATPPNAGATIAEAQLCRRLSTSDWRCEQLTSPVAPGLLFFYTRVKAAGNTTIEHRWYRDDRLRQSVQLRIQASPGSGYRTYTRRTVTAENAGNWRVEVRAIDGSLLHEERFVVR